MLLSGGGPLQEKPRRKDRTGLKGARRCQSESRALWLLAVAGQRVAGSIDACLGERRWNRRAPQNHRVSGKDRVAQIDLAAIIGIRGVETCEIDGIQKDGVPFV